jgi:hypothetical protein
VVVVGWAVVIVVCVVMIVVEASESTRPEDEDESDERIVPEVTEGAVEDVSPPGFEAVT